MFFLNKLYQLRVICRNTSSTTRKPFLLLNFLTRWIFVFYSFRPAVICTIRNSYSLLFDSLNQCDLFTFRYRYPQASPLNSALRVTRLSPRTLFNVMFNLVVLNYGNHYAITYYVSSRTYSSPISINL